eukprot:CAMPEP_0194742620 /NCGR_PEP_ID=MMETSP0296-20130528/99862_1 /TAXON_ID=39354 /ORGANISM="Heterosigma akashiwo, Strain CCMP2393" /LENGTH=532 /DNA_ID=CAMNT_0039654567 /DNA_START=98 /DNA_END=1698 /DNA_ORIENTATION=-
MDTVGGIPFVTLEGLPCKDDDKSLASVADKGRGHGFFALEYLFAPFYNARARTFRARALDGFFAKAENNGVKDLMPWIRDYFEHDEDTFTRQILVILAAMGNDEQAALLPPDYHDDRRARNLTHTLTTYARTMVQRQMISQHRPRHPSLAMFLHLCLATIPLLFKVTFDFGSGASASSQPASTDDLCKNHGATTNDLTTSPKTSFSGYVSTPVSATIPLLFKVTFDFGSGASASSQPASSFASDNGGGMRSGDDLSGAPAAQPLQHGGDGEEDSLLPKLIDISDDYDYVDDDKSKIVLPPGKSTNNYSWLMDQATLDVRPPPKNDIPMPPPRMPPELCMATSSSATLPTWPAKNDIPMPPPRMPPELCMATSSSATLPTWPAPALPPPTPAPAPAPPRPPDDLALVATLDTGKPAPAPAPPRPAPEPAPPAPPSLTSPERGSSTGADRLFHRRAGEAAPGPLNPAARSYVPTAPLNPAARPYVPTTLMITGMSPTAQWMPTMHGPHDYSSSSGTWHPGSYYDNSGLGSLTTL